MEFVILIVCLVLLFVTITGLHLYTMSKISNAQKSVLYGSKTWKDLEKGLICIVCTMLVILLFSILLTTAFVK